MKRERAVSSKSHRDASVVARVQRLLDDRVVVLVRDPNHVGNRGRDVAEQTRVKADEGAAWLVVTEAKE